MPIKPTRQQPTLRRKRGTAREELKQENRSGTPVPAYGRKPLPDLDEYPVHDDGTPWVFLCREKEYRAYHEIDWNFAGWAKGYADGRFDVSCRLCGEVGFIVLKIDDKAVTWG